MRRLLLVPVLLAPLLLTGGAGPASAACATRTSGSVSGTLAGQDDRDVNASIGFDVIDDRGRPIDADPASATYGCAKTGGYSVAHVELNHFVSNQGATTRRGPWWRPAAGGAQVDTRGQRTTRAWRISDLPSNARSVWIETYSRGYQGSPCRDAQGNYCFNPRDVSKYGYANEQYVAIGTRNLAIRLPLTCKYGGKTATIAGTVTDGAGRPVALAGAYAWTSERWDQGPAIQGWGETDPAPTGQFSISALATGQVYHLIATTSSGRVIDRTQIAVSPCATTRLSLTP